MFTVLNVEDLSTFSVSEEKQEIYYPDFLLVAKNEIGQTC